MKSRDVSLDIIRILACCMVVLMHSPIPCDDAPGPFLTALSYLTAPCIGLFFMVSGALLLPVKTDYFTFLNRRFGKIAVPTLLWSLIYIALKIYHSESEINILQTLISIPFTPQGNGVLWFMYTLAGLYLLAPIISPWLEKARKQELRLVLTLWAVTLCYPILSFWISVGTSTTGILYYFAGYAGYFVLGFYLRKYPDSLSLTLSGTLAAGGALLLLLLKYLGIGFDFYTLFWYQSIFIAALATATWKACTISHNTMMHSKLHTRGGICSFSKLTFGIYLIHILVMRHWLWQQEWILQISNYPLQCITIALITMLLSAIVCATIARLPGSEWIIGYHRSPNPGSAI